MKSGNNELIRIDDWEFNSFAILIAKEEVGTANNLDEGVIINLLSSYTHHFL